MTKQDQIFRQHDDSAGQNGGNLDIDQVDRECAHFQASMAERIMAGEDLQQNPHMLTCERCRALVGELEAIAEVARQLLPIEEDPDEDLWIKIERKLALEGSQPDDGKLSLDGGMALEGGVA